LSRSTKARTATLLGLMLVFVLVNKDLFVILLLVEFFVLLWMIINRLVDFLAKKKNMN
jgi:hypothetical protein